MSVTLLLVIAALVCFLLATFNVPTKVSTVALGLALVTIAWLVGHT